MIYICELYNSTFNEELGEDICNLRELVGCEDDCEDCNHCTIIDDDFEEEF